MRGGLRRYVRRLWPWRRRPGLRTASLAAGAKLHRKLVLSFSLIAAIPTILVAVFAALLFNYGVQSWFSEPVRTAIEESVAVAEAYLVEHQQTIKADALGMAQFLERQPFRYIDNQEVFDKIIQSQVEIRSLSEAIVFNASGDVVGRSRLSFVLEFDTLPLSAIEKARDGEVVVLTNESDNRVRALVYLDGFVGHYLYIGRFIDPQVLSHTAQTKEAVEDYEQLEVSRFGLQIKFALIFIILAVILLLGSIVAALTMARQLTRPISNLISASLRVRDGDLSIRVDEPRSHDEMSILTRAFNRMTKQLQTQRHDLVEANRQLDSRRRFTEAVLSGVSAGVIGLDEQGLVQFPNRRALHLLGLENIGECIGKPVLKVLPEIREMMEQVVAHPDKVYEQQIKVTRGGQAKTYLVRITVEMAQDEVEGYVVTLDDISDLLTAQRVAAWSDVARRLAHEIKNPLTPIQLSAERLKRKYTKEIQSDPQTFEMCTDTIIRQVGSLGRMVDEFSSFARMPAPQLQPEDLSQICDEAVLLLEQANPQIKFIQQMPDSSITMLCDARQMQQVLINLLQNAVDAITTKQQDAPEGYQGMVTLVLGETAKQIELAIVDNGIGLPETDRERLTEPYITTRKKGTGLGLAIVKKIVEDHSGELILEQNETEGATIRLVFRGREAGKNTGKNMGQKK